VGPILRRAGRVVKRPEGIDNPARS